MLGLLKAVIGLLTPIRITSRLYLIDQLRRFGADVNKIPEPCLQELADEIVRTTKSIAAMSHCGWREIITDQVEGSAVNLSRILDGSFYNDPISLEYKEHFAKILDKYNVRYP
jgi:hypothetical protein